MISTEMNIQQKETALASLTIPGEELSESSVVNEKGCAELEKVARRIEELASFDSDFRARLLQDPQSVLSELLVENGVGEISLPGEIIVDIYQETDSKVYLDLNSVSEMGQSNSPLSEVLQLVGGDVELAARLMYEPKATIEELLSEQQGRDINLPDELEIEVLGKDSRRVRVVLPRELEGSQSPIEPDELEGISVSFHELPHANTGTGESHCGSCGSCHLQC